MTQVRLLGALIGLLLIGTGCSEAEREPAPASQAAVVTSSRARASDTRGLDYDAYDADGDGPAGPRGPAGSAASAPADAALAAMASARKLVREGAITVEVSDADAAARAMAGIAERHGGYVADMQGQRDPFGRRSATVAVRVEPRQFMQALDEMRALGSVTSEAVTTHDVGKAYADLEARLATKQAAAARMRQIMESRTGSLNDVIAAEAQVGVLLEQIEQLEGERRYYDAQVSLSTIAATLVEPDRPDVRVTAKIPFLDPIRDAFDTGRRHFVTVLAAATYVATVAGPWLLLTVLGWALAHRLRRRTA